MYQVLYRKWRAQTFGEIVGQAHVTQTLRTAVARGTAGHAYLFTGSRGTGKTSCARILAKAVNCPAQQDGEPCNVCAVCKGLDAGTLTDVAEIDAASNNGVDNIRDLREEVNYMPALCKYRVFIIDEVHMLSAGAFNALLKTLEEPPAHVVFILATTEIHKLPATVVSRCQRFDFRRIGIEDIVKRLLHVAGEEKIDLSPDAAALIARTSDGALRDALSLLDRCRRENQPVDAAYAASCLGLAETDYLFDLFDAILAKDAATALAQAESLYTQGADVDRLETELLRHLRNLLVCASVKTAEPYVAAAPQDLPRFAKQAQKIGIPWILNAIREAEACAAALRTAADRRLSLDLLLVRLCAQKPEAKQDMSALERRCDALEQQLRRLQNTTPAVHPAATNENLMPPVPKDTAPLPPAGDDVPFAAWTDVLEQVKSSNPALWGILIESSAILRATKDKGEFCLIDCANPTFLQFMRENKRANSDIRAALTAVTGRTLRIGPYKSAETPPFDPLARLAERTSGAHTP